MKAIIFNIVDHPGLLLVEEFPYLQHIFQVVSGNLVEVTLLSGQLFLILFFQNLKVKIEKSLDFWSVFSLQRIDIGEKLVECREEPLVELGPIRWKVLLHEDAGH